MPTGKPIEWSDWLNGEAWTVVRGTDFQSSSRRFTQALREAARRHGLKAVARIDGDTVRFFAFSPNADETGQGDES